MKRHTKMSKCLYVILCITGNLFILTKKKKKYENIDFEASKKQYYCNVLYSWIKSILEGKTIGEYLCEKNMKLVAVYGWGELGKRLCDDIEKTDEIKILYVIDRNAGKIGDCKYTTVSDVNAMIKNVDLIIVTPFLEYEKIKKDMLQNGVESEIVSLEDIIYDL